MKKLEITTTASGPLFAFPLSQAPSLANWSAKRVALTGSNGYFSGMVNTTLDGNIWLVFSGESAPANFDAWLFRADFSLEDVPKFGQTQRWTNPTESLDVTVTKVT